MTEDEYKAKFAAFAETLDSVSRDDWYGTELAMWKEFQEKFLAFEFQEQREKQKRYEQYLELKKEFEGAEEDEEEMHPDLKAYYDGVG